MVALFFCPSFSAKHHPGSIALKGKSDDQSRRLLYKRKTVKEFNAKTTLFLKIVAGGVI